MKVNISFSNTEKYYLQLLRLIASIILLYMISNYTYDNGIFKSIIQLSCLLTIILIHCSSQSRLEKFITLSADIHAVSTRSSYPKESWLVIGGVALVLILSFLEWKQPFYFTQDDTHSQFLPVQIAAMRGFFEEGVFPTWNGYLFLGTPTTSYGYFSLTYPLTYLCYGVARFLLGNEYLTQEIFAYTHFIGGYLICYILIRLLGVRDCLAASASLCFILLGCNLITGRSWGYMIPTVLWLPALGYSLAKLVLFSPTYKWILLTGLSIGIYFHSGNIQYWSYGCLFWGVGVLLIALCKRQDLRENLCAIFIAALIGMAMSMPLLVAQYLELQDFSRGQMDTTIEGGLKSLLLPWPIVSSHHPWGPQINPGVFYFSGGVFTFIFFLRIAFDAAYLAKGPLKGEHMPLMCISFLALLAFILAMGPKAYLWNWLVQVEPFSKFRNPFKLLPFLTFFIILSGVLFAETLCRKISFGKKLALALSSIALVLSTYNASNAKAAFYYWNDKPYPALAAGQRMFQATGFSTKRRVNAFAHFFSTQLGYTTTLFRNYPSIYQIPTQYGYSLIEESTPEYRSVTDLYNRNQNEYRQEYAVEWLSISKLPNEPRPFDDQIMKNLYAASNQIYDLGITEALNIATPDTKHMAYVVNEPQTPLPYKIRTDGVDIKIGDVELGEKPQVFVIANFLHRHWFKAYTDQETDLEVRKDAMGRIAVKLTKPASLLSIRYSPPWHYGFAIGTVLLAIAAMLEMAVRKKTRKADAVSV